MKKISIVAVLVTITLPVMANAGADTKSADVVEQYSKQFGQPIMQSRGIYSNPETKFPKGLQLGLGVSPTSGLNAFVGYNNKKFESFWWKRFGFRLDFASFSMFKNALNNGINKYVGDDGIKINDNLKLNNANMDANHFGAMIDFYPFGDTWFIGGWRISGGYYTGKLDINADIKTNKDLEFKLGDRTYKYTAGEMQGTSNVHWDYKGPYLGTGFDLGLFAGLKIYLDAGVVFANNHARVNLDVPLTSDLKDITNNPAVPEDISGQIEVEYETAKAKALADAQKELDKYSAYPLVKIGFMYRF